MKKIDIVVIGGDEAVLDLLIQVGSRQRRQYRKADRVEVQVAAAEAQRQARLIERRGAARDHPALISPPESLYLKCLIIELE